MTTTGIFLKQEKKLEGLARKRARRERGYPSERSETFHRFSLFMWDWPRPRQGRWRKSDWLLSKFPFPWPPLRLHFRLSFYLVPLCLTILFFLRPFFVFSLLPLLTPWRGWCVPREKKSLSDLEDEPGNQKGFPLCYQSDLSLWDDGHTSVYDQLCDRWPLLTSPSDFSSASVFLISALFPVLFSDFWLGM